MAPATLILTAANCLLFLYSHDLTMLGGSSLRRNALLDWATYGFPISELGEWWRLVTGAFLHADIRHVLLNMIMLFLLGRRLEQQIGNGYFLGVCATSLLWGSAGALIAAPNTAVVGASGVVYGLMGCLLVVERLSGGDPWSDGLGTLIIVNVILSFVVPGISIGGHLGGLVGGLLCGFGIGDWRRRRLVASFISLATLVGVGGLLGYFAAGTWLNPLF